LSPDPESGENYFGTSGEFYFGIDRPDAAAERFAQRWVGTIRWRMQSQVRAHHKRANWFVGVFRLPDAGQSGAQIDAKDVTFATLRAGGPGGQHQNTTDSAVRASHGPTGLSVVVRDGRSQHQNKSLALKRLQSLADAQALSQAEGRKTAQNQLHHQLQRGNPVRRFKGAAFEEER
jgi:peptide chain release factor